MLIELQLTKIGAVERILGKGLHSCKHSGDFTEVSSAANPIPAAHHPTRNTLAEIKIKKLRKSTPCISKGRRTVMQG